MKICIFEINNQLYYIELNKISEFLPFPKDLRKIPLSKENVLGLFMQRNEVITVHKIDGSNFSMLIKINNKAYGINSMIGFKEIKEENEEILIDNKIVKKFKPHSD